MRMVVSMLSERVGEDKMEDRDKGGNMISGASGRQRGGERS